MNFRRKNTFVRFLAACIALSMPFAACQKSVHQDDPKASMSQKTFADAGNRPMGYWLYTPVPTRSDMPLIVYLHGGSGRGDDPGAVGGTIPERSSPAVSPNFYTKVRWKTFRLSC